MNSFLKFLKIFFLFAFFIAFSSNLKSQERNSDKAGAFSFDAVVFKSDSDSLGIVGRLDVFAIVPFQTLEFVKTGELYLAGYEMIININDSTGKLVETKTVKKSIREKDYFTAQGGNGKFDYSQTIFGLKAGKYEVEAVFTDSYNRKSSRKTRDVIVTDFSKFNFTLSGMMFVSSIEEKGSRFVITPHVSDNVGELKDGFFVFYETYSKLLDTIDIFYEVLDKSNEVKFKSPKQRIKCTAPSIQHYLKVKLPAELSQNNYKLRLIAIKPSSGEEVRTSDYLAISERTIKFFRVIGSFVMNDLEKAVRQLKYVANSSELDYIKEAKTPDEKQRRFDDFWKNLDPSPNTEINEAFEEYYSRIEYANQNFRSYTEGWNTDKGLVFIVYGKPSNVERTNSTSDSRVYERWTYQSNRQYTFVDNSGFGEFRLYQPMTVTDKYKFER